MDEVSMRPIGVVESCFGEKFGTPRQSGVVKSAPGKVVFESWVDPEACRGMEEFSHIWLVFLFDQVQPEEVKWLVRPPRLGGNVKKGVFATRSPFRPNRIGMSVVKLEGVMEGGLEVSGLDLVNGTPVLDVKPYLPYVEALPEAEGGFAAEGPERLTVEFAEGVADGLSDREFEVVSDLLAVDHRPGYHEDGARIYGGSFFGKEFQWRVRGGRVEVLAVRSG